MTMVRDHGPIERFTYLVSLPLDRDDASRLDVAEGPVAAPGIYVNAMHGESRFFDEGAELPEGVWIAQAAIDSLKPAIDVRDSARGFGEGWGSQSAQTGGDRSYPEEDSGGTRRVPHDVASDTDPYVDSPTE